MRRERGPHEDGSGGGSENYSTDEAVPVHWCLVADDDRYASR